MLSFRAMRSVRVNAVVLLASTALTGAAVAQVESVDEMQRDVITVTGALTRYSATKSDTPLAETPRAVSIVTSEELIERGALNLADAYTYAAGVTGETFGFATRGDWVAVRGLSVPEYRDSLQALFGNYNNSRSDIYTLEQVEILRGPAAVLYGQGSPGGIVNVVSKTPRDEFQGEIIGQIGSHDHYQLAADFTGPLTEDGSLLYRLVGVYRDTGTQIGFVDEEAMVFAPSITWRPSPDTNLTLLANIQTSDSKAGAQFLPIAGTLLPAPNGEFFDPNVFTGDPNFDRYNTDSTSFTLLADHRVNENLLLEATVRQTSGEADYRQAWHSFIGGDRWVYDGSGALYRGGFVPRTFYVSDAESEQFAADIRARINFTTGALNHNILAGAQYQDVETDNDFAYAAAVGFDWVTRQPDAVFGDYFWINPFDPVYGNYPTDAQLAPFWYDAPVSSTQDFGLYFQDQVQYQNWLVTAGLRYDEVETDPGTGVQKDDTVSTSFAVMYLFDNGFNPYVSYAESFEPIIGTMFDGSAFEPQEGSQYEIGFKYQPVGSSALFSVAWFDIEQTNLLTDDPVNIGFQVQGGQVDITGVEFESRWDWQTFTFELNASQLNSETSDGFQLASIPEFQSSGWVSYRPAGGLENLTLGAGYRYVGESQNGADSLETPEYTLFDARIAYELEQWSLALNARNLTDEKYFATCLARGDCFTGEDRTITARVARRF